MKGISYFAAMVIAFVFLGGFVIPVIIFGICESIWHNVYRDDVKNGLMTESDARKAYYKAAAIYTPICLLIMVLIAYLYIS